VIKLTKINSDIYDITGILTGILALITRQTWVRYDKIGTICNHYRKEKFMAHELETQNGKASFASLREPAWHGLGTVFQDEVNTQKMLELANLNGWNVRLEELEIPSTLTSDKSYQYVVRTNPTDKSQTDVLGIVGERYVPLQNEDLFAFGDNILDGGGRWETAGSIRGGRVVFGSLAIDKEIVLDPKGVADKVKTYLLINTSHDGSVAIQASVTPVRVVCANTLNLALGRIKKKDGVKQSFKIRHTQTAEGKIAIARTALGLATAYMDEFSILANELYAKEITAQQFNEIILKAYPKPQGEKKIALTKWTNKVDTLNDIYTGEYNHMIAGTAWGALNALTERLDWHRSARRGSNEAMLASASGFDAQINAEKNRLLKVVQSVLA
jgi:phage/plasmid-like protein (TIGR03299 family)